MKNLFLILAIIMFSIQGCSALKPNTQLISVTCTPPDIILKINGDRQNCPAKVEVRRDSKMFIEAKKEGYDPFTKTVDYHLSDSGKADAVGLFVLFFPVFGLLTPGAWDLDQTDFNIVLYPLNDKQDY